MDVRTHLDLYYIEPFRRQIRDFLVPSIRAGAVALDLGCGLGEHTESLRAMGLAAIGLDIDRGRVARARRSFPRSHFLVGTATALPFAAGSVDVLFSCSVLQYVDHDAVLAECRRVLRPGGRAVFVENLRGHPLARLHRRLLRGRRRSHPDHRIPRRHIDLAHLDPFAAHLQIASIETTNLLAPLALAPRLIAKGATGRTVPGRLEAALFAADRRLLAKMPWLSRYCWTVLVCATRRPAAA